MTVEFIDLPQLSGGRRNGSPAGFQEHLQPCSTVGGAGRGVTEVRDLFASDDTERMLDALKALGVGVTTPGGESWAIAGCGGRFPVKQAELFLGNAGIAFRPLPRPWPCLGAIMSSKGSPACTSGRLAI